MEKPQQTTLNRAQVLARLAPPGTVSLVFEGEGGILMDYRVADCLRCAKQILEFIDKKKWTKHTEPQYWRYQGNETRDLLTRLDELFFKIWGDRVWLTKFDKEDSSTNVWRIHGFAVYYQGHGLKLCFNVRIGQLGLFDGIPINETAWQIVETMH